MKKLILFILAMVLMAGLILAGDGDSGTTTDSATTNGETTTLNAEDLSKLQYWSKVSPNDVNNPENLEAVKAATYDQAISYINELLKGGETVELREGDRILLWKSLKGRNEEKYAGLDTESFSKIEKLKCGQDEWNNRFIETPYGKIYLDNSDMIVKYVEGKGILVGGETTFKGDESTSLYTYMGGCGEKPNCMELAYREKKISANELSSKVTVSYPDGLYTNCDGSWVADGELILNEVHPDGSISVVKINKNGGKRVQNGDKLKIKVDTEFNGNQQETEPNEEGGTDHKVNEQPVGESETEQDGVPLDFIKKDKKLAEELPEYDTPGGTAAAIRYSDTFDKSKTTKKQLNFQDNTGTITGTYYAYKLEETKTEYVLLILTEDKTNAIGITRIPKNKQVTLK